MIIALTTALLLSTTAVPSEQDPLAVMRSISAFLEESFAPSESPAWTRIVDLLQLDAGEQLALRESQMLWIHAGCANDHTESGRSQTVRAQSVAIQSMFKHLDSDSRQRFREIALLKQPLTSFQARPPQLSADALNALKDLVDTLSEQPPN